ncbi:MAG TPA: hypothetical protein VND54_00425 [Candidatus Saccharimonadales bacterium]|nr:hypothetical protein [Candidatus Saccharimonadales bacterium]
MASSRRPTATAAAAGALRALGDSAAGRPSTACPPDAVREWVERSCAAQEITVLVSNVGVLAQVVAIARLDAADVGAALKPRAREVRHAPGAAPTDRASARVTSAGNGTPSAEAAR